MAIDASGLNDVTRDVLPPVDVNQLKLKPLIQPKKTVSVEADKPIKSIDFSKLKESDIYNLDIPIQSVEHKLPEHLDVVLKDTTYHPRWVNEHAQRIGTMKQMGWTYVQKEDLAENLNINTEPDENGVYKSLDVVLMKMPKEKLYGMLRKNHLNNLALTNNKQLHERERNRIRGEFIEHSQGAYDPYEDANKIGVI